MNRTSALRPVAGDVCRLVLGTGSCHQLSELEAHELFDAYVSLGGNCFDTALVYFGIESVIGSWMRSRGNRSAVIVDAKGAHHETIRPSGAPHEFHRARVNPVEIVADIDEILRRLGTDYLDVFTLHRDDPDQPVGPILDCLAGQQTKGRIRGYGLSNWSVERLEEAREYAVSPLSSAVPPTWRSPIPTNRHGQTASPPATGGAESGTPGRKRRSLPGRPWPWASSANVIGRGAHSNRTSS